MLLNWTSGRIQSLVQEHLFVQKPFLEAGNSLGGFEEGAISPHEFTRSARVEQLIRSGAWAC
jgi:hypothetical protein